ncbi:MAG: DUF3868 domain-containing protein [Paramuribaculum sp.]|nr:DUF3868 domain-containing protein [Paramuribaculum sp.]
MRKTTIFVLATLLGLGSASESVAQKTQDVIPGVSVNGFAMTREGKYLAVEMAVDLTRLDVNSNRAVLLTPRLVNGTDSLDMPAIGIYGRRRYYYYTRNGMESISGDKETIFRASKKPDNIDYQNRVFFEDWMDGAALKFHRSDWGCCHEILAEYEGGLGTYHEEFFPELVFVRPKAEIMKTRSLSGSAFIDFPVDQTVIYPEYRRNTVELGKIQATIDSVRGDNDVTITSVWLKGFASPESPYSHNTDLAVGRTKALKEHIRRLYDFPESIILTEYEPEDWEGLRRYVENSNLEHRAEILTLIDTDMDPDAKELKIKRTYPQEYRFLLQHCYPALRHTDYRIDYNLRSFNDAEEIKRIMAKQPGKLNLNEFYIVAGTCEPGTVEFTDVFETAVRMFPDDEIANLNAANAAIRQDNFKMARRYLAKAGGSAETEYAKGALAIREEDYKTAVVHMKKASQMGLQKAETILAELEKRGHI